MTVKQLNIKSFTNTAVTFMAPFLQEVLDWDFISLFSIFICTKERANRNRNCKCKTIHAKFRMLLNQKKFRTR
jgi:hypothetical protein